jgi:hypothetical protein
MRVRLGLNLGLARTTAAFCTVRVSSLGTLVYLNHLWSLDQ